MIDFENPINVTMKAGKLKRWDVMLFGHVQLMVWVILAKDGMVLSNEVFNEGF